MKRLPMLSVILAFGLAAAVAIAAEKKPAESDLPPPARTVLMKGTVFEDLNANGRREADEPPISDMPVSDGLTFTITADDGQFAFALDEKIRGSVFVCTPAGWRASSQFFVLADFDRFDGRTQPADIGLLRDPARNTDRFCFVQLSDTHVTAADEAIRTMKEDIAVVNRLSDTPVFVVTTGDVVNIGKAVDEFKGYVQGTRDIRFPYYNVIGNHDYGGQARSTQNYEEYLGPPYYSFDVGPYHFIAKDIVCVRGKDGVYERQMKWMEEDIRLNAAGKRIIMFQHFLPTNPELDWLADHNGVAIYSGHWHGRRERLYKGVLDVNSSTLRFGGIDRSPRGFRIVHIDGDEIRCEWRVGNQEQRVEILQPPVDGEVGPTTVDLRVLAYDSAVRVRQVRYRIFDGGKPADAAATAFAEGDLFARGSWAWTGTWAVPGGTAPGPKWIQVDVAGHDGSVWTSEGAFTLTARPAPAVMAGGDWPFFHNDAGHRGYLEAGPRPPLVVAWATHIGGTIHISSPVIADGRVYAASSYEDSLDDCAVSALDLATGRQLWRAPVDSSVTHSLAAYGDRVLAVSEAGTLYCFDSDGYPCWTASLDRQGDTRWELSFPVTDGKAVYAGRASGFGAYDLETGEPLWRQGGGRDWWPNIYSGPSIGTGVVYQGGAFVRALNPTTGDVLWEKTKTAVSTVAVVPAVVERGEQGDRLYVFNIGQTLRCLDGSNGEAIWDAHAGSDAGQVDAVPLGDETGTPSVGADVVCLGGTEGKTTNGRVFPAAMYGFDKATGRMLWTFPVGEALAPTVPYKRDVCTITSSPVIVGEVVYFGASDGWFYALDVHSGQCLWKRWFGLPIASTVAVTGNTVIVATWDGTIYALIAGP